MTTTTVPPFVESDFTDGTTRDKHDNPYQPVPYNRMDTPGAKARVANGLIAFLEAGCPEDLFRADPDLYYALNQKLFGHVAEFGPAGFYGAWFSTPQRIAKWVERAMKGGPYGFSDMARPRLWGDVERLIAGFLDSSGLGARLIEAGRADTERQEREQLAALLAKYPDAIDAEKLKAFRAGVVQEQDQHDFDYHGGKIDPSAGMTR